MPILLWHSTWPRNIESILANGFRDGEHGFVFFGPPYDFYWKLSNKVILEVTLDVGEDAIDSYKRSSYDSENGNFCQVTYRIPATFVNEHKTRIRIVPDDEQHRHP